MRAIGETPLLRRERGGNRPTSGTAGKHDIAAGRIRNDGGIEAGQRNENGVGKALDRGLIRLAHVNEHDTAVLQALRDLQWRQVPYLRILIRHFTLHAPPAA
jgi:hypothetical protein